MSPYKIVSRCLLGGAILCLLICFFQFFAADSSGITERAVYQVSSIFLFLGAGVVLYIASVVVVLLRPKGPPPLPLRVPKPPLDRNQIESLIKASKPGAKPPPIDRPPTYKLD